MKIVHRFVIIISIVFAASLSASSPTGSEGGGDLVTPAFSGPDFKEVLDLQSASNPRIAPDGSAVLYTVGTVDWEENRYDSEIWLARKDGQPFQLTRTEGKSSSSPKWSPDGKRIAFLADRGDDTQIWLISALGGEARRLTAVEDGVSGFEWSPDGKLMAVTITDAEDSRHKTIEEKYGAFAVEDAEFRMTHLWVLDVKEALDSDGGVGLPPAEKEDEDTAATGVEEADGDEEEPAA